MEDPDKSHGVGWKYENLKELTKDEHPLLFSATTKLSMLVVGAGGIFTVLPIIRSDKLVIAFQYGDKVVTDTSIIWGFLLLLFLLFDSLRRLGHRDTILFMVLIFGLVFPTEYLGSKYGWFFGRYVYSQEKVLLPFARVYLGQVPFVIILCWWIVVYLSFFTTNTLAGSHRFYPESVKTGGKAWPIFQLLQLAVVDGFIATSLDLSFEPLSTEYYGLWSWLDADGGNFIVAPTSNYIHWFLLVMVISLIFRAYLQTRHTTQLKQLGSEVRFWPEYAAPLIYFLFQFRMSVIIFQNMSNCEFVFSSIVATLILMMAIILFKRRKQSHIVKREFNFEKGHKRRAVGSG